MSAYFVAGTGTGVGKTFTTCALLHAARMQGKAAIGLKPVLSGFDAADAQGDAHQIMAAMDTQLHQPLTQPSPARGEGSPVAPLQADLPIESISPYRFAAPLSPHRAAALEGKTIDVAALTAWTQARVKQHDGITLIEGVGGVMVPLTERDTTLDWMDKLGLPIILVTGSYLGTISHTLTALEVLKSRGLRIHALVMNESAGASVTLAEAWAGLAPFIGDIPWRICQPLVSSFENATALQALEL